MTTQGIPVEGLTTVGQIVGTNTERFHPWRNGESVAIALLSSHTAGAPVVDDEGHYLGFINEFDVMRVLAAKKDLTRLTAKDIMRRDRLTVSSQTTINDAAHLMETHTVIHLPVEENGVVAHSISRHDLLRAKLGVSRDGTRSVASPLMMRPTNRRSKSLIENWAKETTRRKYESEPVVLSNNDRAHVSRQKIE